MVQSRRILLDDLNQLVITCRYYPSEYTYDVIHYTEIAPEIHPIYVQAIVNQWVRYYDDNVRCKK